MTLKNEPSRTNELRRSVFKQQLAAPKSFLNSYPKFNSLFSAIRVLSLRQNSLAYNTTASLGKLTCTNYENFGKCQDRIGHFSGAKTIPIIWR